MRMLHFLFNIQHYMMFEDSSKTHVPCTCTFVSADVHIGVCIGMRTGVYTGMCTGVCIGMQVLEPNWHVLQQKLRAASTLDALLAHHAE